MKENVASQKILLIALCCLAAGCAKRGSYVSGQWIDLSYDYSAETIYWPTAEPFKLDTVSASMTEKGYYYSAYKSCAAEHGGTHIDAPILFPVDAGDVIPLRPGSVHDVGLSGKVLFIGADAQIEAGDFHRHS